MPLIGEIEFRFEERGRAAAPSPQFGIDAQPSISNAHKLEGSSVVGFLSLSIYLAVSRLQNYSAPDCLSVFLIKYL